MAARRWNFATEYMNVTDGRTDRQTLHDGIGRRRAYERWPRLILAHAVNVSQVTATSIGKQREMWLAPQLSADWIRRPTQTVRVRVANTEQRRSIRSNQHAYESR